MNVLHLTRKLPALVPQYVSRFNCVGSACPDTCCAGWRVTVDKKTFNAYRQTRNPAVSTLLAKNVTRIRSQGSDGNYARFELEPGTHNCPMLQDSLCSVQKNMNESYLSNTCFTFPRSSRTFAGNHEQALTLSCPEAARQALLHADAFDFVEAEITVRPDMVSDMKSKNGLSVDAMNEIRIFCLQLMRTAGMELWQKLAILGTFCESLSTTLAAEGQGGVAALLNGFVEMIENGMAIDALAGMQPNHELQGRVFASLWQLKKAGGTSDSQRQVFSAVAAGFGADRVDEAIAIEQMVERYSSGVALLPEALQAAPHLLENYILNEMFRDLFPFVGATPYDAYLQLVSRFGLLRMVLAAQCNTDGALPDADAMVRTVQVYCRCFQHDANFAANVNQALRNSGWARLEKVYGFLRT